MLTAIAGRRATGQSGMTMLEVLITLVILAFGLLGLAGLNIKIQMLEMEAYQRAQGILLLNDMVRRIQANSADAASYLSNPATCPASPTTQAGRDLCDWVNALEGAAESSSGTRVGAMIGARGCIAQLQAPDPTTGVCRPGMYRVTVAWQGMGATAAPSLTCGQGQYGSDDALRRAIANDLVIGLPACL